MVQSGNRFNNSNIIIAGEMCSLGCLSLSLLRLFRLCIRCVLFIGLDVTGTHIVICTHFYQPKRLIPEHLTHGFSAVLCELSGCVGGIKPACIQYYRHCNQPNEWCDVSLCFWCWLWILVRCNICNHIEKSFEELCISRLYQCTNATSIQVQNRNLIHQKKEFETFFSFAPHWWHWKLSMAIQKEREKSSMEWVNVWRRNADEKKSSALLQSFLGLALLALDFYYNSRAIFAIRCQCHILTAWIVCLVSVAHAHVCSFILFKLTDGSHGRNEDSQKCIERKKHVELTHDHYILIFFSYILFLFWLVLFSTKRDTKHIHTHSLILLILSESVQIVHFFLIET